MASTSERGGQRLAQRHISPVLFHTCQITSVSSPSSSYLVTGDSLTNFAVVVGPNTPISNGSLMPAIEAQLEFALGFAKKIQSQSVKAVVVSQEACTEFNDHKDAVMDMLTFSGNCNSWYKNGTSNGRIIGPWCGSVNHFLESLQETRLQDFEFTYDNVNRFAYLGNGLSTREANDQPLGWYIRS